MAAVVVGGDVGSGGGGGGGDGGWWWLVVVGGGGGGLGMYRWRRHISHRGVDVIEIPKKNPAQLATFRGQTGPARQP